MSIILLSQSVLGNGIFSNREKNKKRVSKILCSLESNFSDKESLE